MNDNSIVGWAVFTRGIEQAAIYNLEQREQAFDAAKRWGASIQAVVLHPESPAGSARGEQRVYSITAGTANRTSGNATSVRPAASHAPRSG